MTINLLTQVRRIALPALLLTSINATANDLPTQLDDLKSLTNRQLTALYDQGSAIVVPSAASPEVAITYNGVALPTPGISASSKLLGFFWGGKTFETDNTGKTSLTNVVLPDTPVEMNNVTASVSITSQNLLKDHQPVVLLDYSQTNIALAKGIRDEMRLIGEDLYLGRAYIENDPISKLLTRKSHQFLLWFALKKE
jgi:hypothetical protein